MQRAKEIRLREEFDKLRKLQSRSKFIRITPVDVIPHYPPEKYIVSYSCMGIAGIDDRGNPITSESHRVEMVLPYDFPNREPNLKWLTPIWHPNIEHEEPNHVCTNNIQSWFKLKSLDFLVIEMGEIVQYKRYHAKWEPPYPIDKEVATWVIEFAEPKGIIGPDLPFDKRPLLRKMTTLYQLPDARTTKAKRAGKSGQITQRLVKLGTETVPSPKRKLVKLGTPNARNK